MSHARRPFVWCLTAVLALGACQDDGTPLTEPEKTDIEELEPTPPRMNPQSMGVEGYPSLGEIRTGFIYDRSGQPLEITYEVHDGLAIWQGDIVLGEAHEIASSIAELGAAEPGPLRGVVIDDDAKRWPGGVVPWENDDADPAIVQAAVAMIEDETPGVDLVPYDGSQPNYITFRDASGCSSAIGMQGGQQFINLKVNDGTSFCSIGSGAHEILHALGMYHEHTRCDRDDFVTIDFDEIESGREGNFYKAGSDAQGDDCGDDTPVFDIDAYDPGSIMHYPQFAFAVGSNPTIIPKAGVDGSAMGQRSALGPTDVETVDQLYGANNAAPTATISGPTGDLLEGSVLSFDGSASTDPDDDDDILTFDWTFGDGTCSGGSPPSACSEVAPDHAYADDGEYAFSVTVSDGFDAAAAGSSVTIANVAPSVDAGDDATVNEGDEFSRAGSFDDPGADTWEATVDYGDGSGTQALGLSGHSFDLQHTYVDNVPSPVTVTVTVTDDDDGVGNDEVEVTVNNVAPSVDAGPDATVESGQAFDFSGTFSDPGVEDDPWAWTIDWGDGAENNGETSDQSAAIEASHQVCGAGDYTVTLTVTDKDDGVGSDDLNLTVSYVAAAIDILPESERNPVSLRRRGGHLPVAILGSADLDVADIDPGTLTLGDETDPDTPVAQKRNGTYHVHMEDVNDDGHMDLVAMFAAADLLDNGDLHALSTELVLRGFLGDACTNIRGADTVTPLGF